MLGSHDTVAIRPPSKAVRHREGDCEEAMSKARVWRWGAAEVAVRCHYLMGKRGAMWGGRAKERAVWVQRSYCTEDTGCGSRSWDKVGIDLGNGVSSVPFELRVHLKLPLAASRSI